ncbi:MAG: hypothetical protein KBA30_01660 [Clostridia bacterium]|nr:hypothetical protein [Clostridia bacterium]
MFRRWEKGRLRKRTVIVTAATLAVVAATSGGILWMSARALYAQTPFFRITDSAASSGVVIGAGLNLGDIPSSNLVSDSSFEPLVFHQQLTALSGDGQNLVVSSEEAQSDIYGEGFFNGASIRVMSPADQNLVLRKSASVASYAVNRIGGFQEVRLPADLPDGLVFSAFTQQNDTIVAAGQRGTILVGLDTRSPVSVKTGTDGDLTGICAGPDSSLLVCSREGAVLHSTDAVAWTPWSVPSGTSLHAVAASDDGYVAVGSGGTVLAGSRGALTRVGVPTGADLKDVVWGDGSFLACGDRDTLLLSANGLVWTPLSTGSGTDWTCMDYRDGYFVAAGTDGQVCLVDGDRDLSRSVIPGASDLADIIFLSRRQIIALDSQGRFFVSDDGGKRWTATELEPGLRSNHIAATAQDRIVSASDDGAVGTTRLVNIITLDTPLVEGTFQAGDLVFLEYAAQRLPDSWLPDGERGIRESWNLSRTDAGERRDGDAAPGGGTGCMGLTVTADALRDGEAAFMSQVLVGEGENTRFTRGHLYSVEFWARQEGLESREVKVWLTGRFETVGKVVENVGGTWKKYNWTFLLPDAAANAQPGEIRLHIGIEDAGSVWIDSVWMGSTESLPGQPDEAFSDAILGVAPAVLRFPFLGIGSTEARSGAWAFSPGNESATIVDGVRTDHACGSLETALRLADDAGAIPWLTIGAFASDDEIRNLVEYLAGPMTDPYGKLRMDNGTSHPWTDAFGRICLEIRDDDGIMDSDSRRASYVNHVIDLVRQSPYYPAIRNRITFVDGMTYEASLMLSTADYHASPLDVPVGPAGQVYYVRSAYRTFFDASPRIMNRPSDANYELVVSIRFGLEEGSDPTLSTYLEAAAFGAREGYGILLFSADPSVPGEVEDAARRLAAEYLAGTPLTVETLDSVPSNMTAYAFRSDDSIRILLINHSGQTYSFPLDSLFPLEGAHVLLHDDHGRIVSDEKLRRSSTPVDVLPGGVTVLVVPDGSASE